MRVAGALIALFSVGLACGAGTPGGDCFRGLWQERGGSCQLRCEAANPPSVCTAEDCRMHGFFVFGEEGAYWSGAYLHSASRRTFLYFTPPSRGEWRGTLQEGIAVRDPGEEAFQPVEVACREDGALTVSEFLYYERADPELSASLEANLAGPASTETTY